MKCRSRRWCQFRYVAPRLHSMTQLHVVQMKRLIQFILSIIVSGTVLYSAELDRKDHLVYFQVPDLFQIRDLDVVEYPVMFSKKDKSGQRVIIMFMDKFSDLDSIIGIEENISRVEIHNMDPVANDSADDSADSKRIQLHELTGTIDGIITHVRIARVSLNPYRDLIVTCVAPETEAGGIKGHPSFSLFRRICGCLTGVK